MTEPFYFTVLIKNKETGEVRGLKVEGPWSDIQQYMWEEGNYACDCNRRKFFKAAGKLGDEDVGEPSECGDKEKFSIPEIILMTGEIVYSEEDLED